MQTNIINNIPLRNEIEDLVLRETNQYDIKQNAQLNLAELGVPGLERRLAKGWFTSLAQLVFLVLGLCDWTKWISSIFQQRNLSVKENKQSWIRISQTQESNTPTNQTYKHEINKNSKKLIKLI